MKSALAGTRSPRKEQELIERLAINPLAPAGV